MLQENNQSERPLDSIITAISRHARKQKKEGDDYHMLYKSIEVIMDNFDGSIKQCKKYNEAKALRKYEIIITDLNDKIKYLDRKLTYYREARSSSKDYIEDLLDRLVKFELQNQSLRKQVSQIGKQNQELKAKIMTYFSLNAVKVDSQEMKSSSKQISSELNAGKAEISGKFLAVEVSSYTKFKYEMRKQRNQQKTAFERFLKKNTDKLQFWSMKQFLQAIDQWAVEQALLYEKYSATYQKPIVISATENWWVSISDQKNHLLEIQVRQQLIAQN